MTFCASKTFYVPQRVSEGNDYASGFGFDGFFTSAAIAFVERSYLVLLMNLVLHLVF